MRGKLYSLSDIFGAGPRNVDVVTLVMVRDGSEISSIGTVGDPGATVAGYFVENDVDAGGC